MTRGVVLEKLVLAPLLTLRGVTVCEWVSEWVYPSIYYATTATLNKSHNQTMHTRAHPTKQYRAHPLLNSLAEIR
jgi:hypothetical protein